MTKYKAKIKTALVKTKDEIALTKQTLIAETQKALKDAYEAYKQKRTGFETKLTEHKNALAGDAKTKAAEAAQAAYKAATEELAKFKQLTEVLSQDIINNYGIVAPDGIDLLTASQTQAKDLQKKISRITGEATEVGSEDEAKEMLLLIKAERDRLKLAVEDFKTQKNVLPTNPAAYQKLEELGKKLEGEYANLKKRCASVQKFGIPEPKADGVQLFKEVDEAVLAFKKLLFGVKSQNVDVVTLQNVSDPAVVNTQLDSSALKVNTAELAEKGVPKKIQAEINSLQKTIEAFKADPLGLQSSASGLQASIFEVYKLVGSWLKAVKKGESKATPEAVAAGEKAENQLQLQLNLIGALVISKDTFTQTLQACEDANKLIEEMQTLTVKNEYPNDCDTPQKKSDHLAAKRDATDKAVAKFNSEVLNWQKIQAPLLEKGKQGSPVHTRNNVLEDKKRDLIMRLANLPKSANLNIPYNNFLPSEPYNAAKDKNLKKIEAQKTACEQLRTSTDYKKRYRYLGDLNNIIQIWDFEHRHYREEEIKTSKTTVSDIRTFMDKELDAVNALMSVKALLQEFDRRLLDYAANIENSRGFMLSVAAKFGKKPDTEQLKVDKTKTDPKKYSEIINQAAELQDFISNWLEQYDIAKDAIAALPQEKKDKIESKRQYLLERQKILADFTPTAISGINPKAIKEADALASQALIAKDQQARKVIDLEVILQQLRAVPVQPLTDTQKEILKAAGVNDTTLAIETELNKQKDALKAKELDLKAQQDACAQLRQREDDAPAGKAYKAIVNAFDSRNEDYIYVPSLDPVARNTVRQNINALLADIHAWEIMVVEPNHPNLADYKKHLDVIRFELTRNLTEEGKQSNYDYDKSLKQIRDVFATCKLLYTNNTATKSTLQEFQFCTKLIGHWRKENPMPHTTTQKYFDEVAVIYKFCIDAITGSFFGKIKLQENFQNAVTTLKEEIKETESALQQRLFEAKENAITDLTSVDISAELTQYEKDIQAAIKIANDEIIAQQQSIDQQADDEVQKRIDKLKSQPVLLSQALLAAEKALHKALLKKEQIVFAGFTDLSIDPNSTDVPPDQIDLMKRATAQAVQRAEAVLKSGGSPEEAERMMEHIPATFWPDKFVRELNAFYETEKAFEEENKNKEEATLEELLKPRNLLELASTATANAGGILKDVYDKYDGLFYSKKDSAGEDKDYLGFSGDKIEKSEGTTKIFKNLKMTGAVAKIFSKGVETGLKLTEEEQEKQAEDFILHGKHGETDPVKRAALDKKRIILLAGLEMSSKTMALIAEQVKSKTPGITNGNIASGVLSSISTLIDGFLEISGASDDPKALARSTQEYWTNNIEKVTKVANAVVSVAKSTAEIVGLFTPIASQIVPGIGLAATALSIGTDILNISRLIYKEYQAKLLLKEAEIHERELVNPLEQELHSLRKRIVKKSIDVATDVLSAAGDITTIAGEPAAGTAIKIIAGVLKVGNAIVFKAIDMAEMKRAEKTLEAARAGDREAKIRIFKESPRYAKMLLAIAGTRNPPSPIAVEFLRQRGFTERDLARPTGSLEIINKFLGEKRKEIRQELLSQSEEKDNHDIDSAITFFKDIFERIGNTYNRYQQRKGFWSTTQDHSFARLGELYSAAQLQKLTDEFAASVRNRGLFSRLRYDSPRDMPEFAKLKAMQAIFITEQNAVNTSLIEAKQALKEAIDQDKTSKTEDYSTIIAQKEQLITRLGQQQHDVVELLDAVAILDTL